MIKSSQRRALGALLIQGVIFPVLGVLHHASPRSQKLSLKTNKATAQLAVSAHVGSRTSTGCFFWEDDCMQSEVMCGADNVIHADIKLNACKRFMYFFNHANDHCSIDESTLANYKECFWTELSLHIPDRSRCDEVCKDAHGHLPKQIATCDQQCVHVHDCVDECHTDGYKYRDAIIECFDTCMKMSPVSPVGTCQRSCGKHAPNMKCFCDPTCSYTNDCCDDYQNYCLVAGMRWNESLPLPNMSFKLPGYNISMDDVEAYDDKRKTNGTIVDVTDEVDAKVKERQKKQEEAERRQKLKERVKKMQLQKSKVSNQGKDHEEDGLCFPEHAQVQTPQGRIRISDLHVGDTIKAVDSNGRVFWDEVYFFGHADEASIAKFLQIELDDRTLQISHKHFIPGCLGGVRCSWAEHVTAYAQHFQPGDYIWLAPDDGQTQIEQRQILDIFSIEAKGLYNPYTLSGSIIVNGVVASAHSDWILDNLMPTSWVQSLPAIYQTLFLPGRVLYHLLRMGPRSALEAVVTLLDLNNLNSQRRIAMPTKELVSECTLLSSR